MKSKEEVIKDAWIGAIGEEKFNKSKLSIDKNGWVNSKEVVFLYNEKHPFLNEDFHQSLPKRMSLETQYYVRPNSLNGIDDNFGWISINSESDLPSENGTFWILDKELGIKSGEWRKAPNEVEHKKACEFWIKRATHYQPINKPLPPLHK